MQESKYLIRENYRNINWKYYVYYDADSPTGLRWLNPPGYKMKSGDVAGSSRHSNGRASVRLSDKNYACSLIVWSLFNELKDGFVIDHINGNPVDNKIENLRQVSVPTNMKNTKKKINKIGKTGVYLLTSKTDNYYVANWIDPDGTKRTINYSISKLGEIHALHLATYTRDYFVKMNGNYSDRHGQ